MLLQIPRQPNLNNLFIVPKPEGLSVLACALLTTWHVLQWQLWFHEMKRVQPAAFLRLLILPLAVVGPTLNSVQLRINTTGQLPQL